MARSSMADERFCSRLVLDDHLVAYRVKSIITRMADLTRDLKMCGLDQSKELDKKVLDKASEQLMEHVDSLQKVIREKSSHASDKPCRPLQHEAECEAEDPLFDEDIPKRMRKATQEDIAAVLDRV